MGRKNNNDRLDELCKKLSEMTGLNIRWAGSNGEYCCVGDNPFNYLQGYHTKHDTILYIEGLLSGMAFWKRHHHIKYGMNIQELRDKIVAFTGDKKREAMRKAKIFASHISLRHVSDIRLSFGKYSRTENGKVVYYGENRDTLHIEWRDLDGVRGSFSIIE